MRHHAAPPAEDQVPGEQVAPGQHHERQMVAGVTRRVVGPEDGGLGGRVGVGTREGDLVAVVQRDTVEAETPERFGGGV